MVGDRDELFRTGRPGAFQGGRFTFNEAVVRVFPDMVSRSVPGYGAHLGLLGLLGSHYAPPGSRIYDLGCSWGAAGLAVAAQSGGRALEIVGVDASAGMLHRAAEAVAAWEAQEAAALPGAGPGSPGPSGVAWRWIEADVATVPLEPCSVVILNYTLQFLPVEQRAPLLNRVAEALLPGGVILLAEKTVEADAEAQAEQAELLRAFKQAQGYRDEEIAGKEAALAGVLVPETVAQHRERLTAAGLRPVWEWARGLGFVSLAARKPQ